MRTRRTITLVTLLAAAAAGPACSGESRPPTVPVTSASVPSTSPAPPTRGAAPGDGVVLGAWVQPQTFTEAGREQALTDFEESIGTNLGLVHDFHTWQDPFPSEFDRHIVDSGANLLLSWAGTDTREIAAGRHDEMVRQRARALRALGEPVLLRWRWEMDRPNLASEVIGPAEYVAAWKHLRSLFAEEGADNVGWVWCPLAGGFENGTAPAYYPGDNQVDWICADVYAPDPSVPFTQLAAAFLTWARDHDLPIVLAEVGTQRVAADDRARWLRAAITAVGADPQISAFVYFDSNVSREGRVRHWSLRGWPEDLAVLREAASDRHFQARLKPPG